MTAELRAAAPYLGLLALAVFAGLWAGLTPEQFGVLLAGFGAGVAVGAKGLAQ